MLLNEETKTNKFQIDWTLTGGTTPGQIGSGVMQ